MDNEKIIKLCEFCDNPTCQHEEFKYEGITYVGELCEECYEEMFK